MAEHATTFSLITILALVTILLIFAMKYFSTSRQSRALIMRDEEYRDLAAKTASAQSGAAAALVSIQAELAEIKTRLVAVEKILKEVG